jgi:uncharacterized protein (TIGR00661 family)
VKILYAIQGTGNGHISRARSIIPYLKQYAEVDILISGTQSDVQMDDEVKYFLHGCSFVFGTDGHVSYWKTFLNMRTWRMLRDIYTIPLGDYDLVVNDFEPVTAWACRLRKKNIIGFSHQVAFKSPKVPRSKFLVSMWQELVLKYYAPVKEFIGLHFQAYDDNVYTPIIRTEIRELSPVNNGHYTVYLPSYSDENLIKVLSQLPDVRWDVFSKHSNSHYRVGNIIISPINNQTYNNSLVSCEGLLTGGGFEGPAEAMFLKKKLMVIPMGKQWEQQCNAEALRLMGVETASFLDTSLLPKLRQWVKYGNAVPVDYKDETKEIVELLINYYLRIAK